MVWWCGGVVGWPGNWWVGGLVGWWVGGAVGWWGGGVVWWFYRGSCCLLTVVLRTSDFGGPGEPSHISATSRVPGRYRPSGPRRPWTAHGTAPTMIPGGGRGLSEGIRRADMLCEWCPLSMGAGRWAAGWGWGEPGGAGGRRLLWY